MAPRSPLPFYARVQQLLLERIGREYREGDLLPTQKQLAEETGASLITVKRALAELGRAGLLESHRGRGTIVRRERVEDDHARVSSWTDSITGFGGEPRTAWCKISVRKPPAKRVRQLKLGRNAQTVVIRRLRLVDGAPICLMRNELPLELVPDLPTRGFGHESLYALLASRYRLSPSWAIEEVTSRRASVAERRSLGGSTKIVLIVRRYTMLADGRPLEVSQLIAPADRYRYRVRLTAEPT